MFVTLLALTLAQPPAPQFTSTTATETKSAPWQPLDKSALATLVSLRRAGTPLPPWPRTAGAILANGDRVPGELLGGDDAAVTLKSALGAKGLRLPLPSVRVLWLTPPPEEASEFPDRYDWLDANRKSDVILLRNGDTVAGDIERFLDGGSLRVRRTPDGTAVTLEPTAVAAVAFNPSLTAVRKVKGPFARAVLADGTRISLTNVTADATTLRGTAASGPAVEVPVRDLVSLDVLQGKATALADLKPKAEKVEPFNSLAWPWQPNRTVKARPLRLWSKIGTSTFDTGLGTHPRTTLTYSLNGKYRRFTALVGLDADTGRRGTASVKILVDGKEQPVEGLAKLSTATGPVAVSVDLAKAKELTLLVDFGPAGDVQADVNWADAKLVE
jgi:hypothetical protein